jgi:hypothetical protein
LNREFKLSLQTLEPLRQSFAQAGETADYRAASAWLGPKPDWQALQREPSRALGLFEEAFRRTGCTLSASATPAGDAPAAYLPFIYYPTNGGATFQNEILVNAYIKTGAQSVAARTPEQINISQRHEKVHAVQWDRVPALHASPYNQATPVVLSPESWVLMTILTEREAFTKTAWLNALELKAAPSEPFGRQARTETLTPDDIDLEGGDIRASLQRASLAWDQRLKGKPVADTPDTTLLDHYIQQALRSYEDSNRLNTRKLPPPVFVRLSPEDILAIGSTFGPSTFGEDTPEAVFTSPPLMRPDLWERLQELNRLHGIEDERALPTFKEAIGTLGFTPDSYMAQSKAHVHAAGGKKPRQGEQSYEIQNADHTPGL